MILLFTQYITMSKRRSGLSNHRRAYTYNCENIKTNACDGISIEGFQYTSTFFSPDGDYLQYNTGYALQWNSIPNVSVYNIVQLNNNDQTFEITSSTSGNWYSNGFNDDNNLIIHAHVTGCPDISTSVGAPCFFHDAIITMADGSTKAIEEVRVGDLVLGAFGEFNEVLALHRPLLGYNTMTNINNDHHTSSHHPHVSPDKQFYSVKPSVVMSDTYGKSHEVLDENMVPYQRFLAGLKPGRVQQMEIGVQLKTVDGSREITFLETYEMAPETQLYNLVVSGSHTYHVDGYAVTGWPNEDDFDYDTWTLHKLE
jgi:hypothetical protein